MPEVWSTLRFIEKQHQNHQACLEKDVTDLAFTKRMDVPRPRWQEGHFLEREQNAARNGAPSQTERWAKLNVPECFRTLIHKYSNKHKGLLNSERGENSHPLLLVFQLGEGYKGGMRFDWERHTAFQFKNQQEGLKKACVDNCPSIDPLDTCLLSTYYVPGKTLAVGPPL